MKALKITLAIIAFIGIGVFVIFNYTQTTNIDDVDTPNNQFTDRIEKEISDIKHRPNMQFCMYNYKLVKYYINEFASINGFGSDLKDENGNSENKKYLFNKLYDTYADKFISQANYVFSGSTWPTNDLDFIKKEAKSLQTENSKVDRDFSELIKTVDAYYSEVAFIKKCNSFSYNNTNWNEHFPINTAQEYISKSKSRLSSLGVVKNSEIVKNGLSNIPKKVFDAHVNYLEKKLNKWLNYYMHFETLEGYKELLYNKLEAEINQLDSTMNHAGLNASSQKKKTSLLNRLEEDYIKAEKYFRYK